MFNKLLGDFINGAISAHTSRIKNQDVSLKFLQNSLNISELELYKFALFQYGFPIVIKCGIVKNIEIVIPWASFQNDDVKITIDDIFILAAFPENDPTNFISDQDLYDIREHQLESHQEFAEKFSNILKQISSQKLSQIAKRVMHSCSVTVKNLHFRIENEDRHSFGIITSSINIFTQNPSKGVPPLIEKNINFNDFAVYLDLNQGKVEYHSINEFISTMKKLSKIDNNNHQFLLEPSLISAKLTSSTEKEASDIEILTDLNNIVISISKSQLPVISKMASNVKKFNQFMFIKKCKQFADHFKQSRIKRSILNAESNATENNNKNMNKILTNSFKIKKPNKNLFSTTKINSNFFNLVNKKANKNKGANSSNESLNDIKSINSSNESLKTDAYSSNDNVNYKENDDDISLNSISSDTNDSFFSNSNKNSQSDFNQIDIDDFDPSLNWIFIHTLAKKKNDCHLDSILDRIIYRNRYVKEWNMPLKKSTRTELIEKMDHKLEYQAILFFRALADSIKSLSLKINYDEILRFVNFDPLLLIPSFASRFIICASTNLMKIKYLNQEVKFDSSAVLKGLSIKYGHNEMHLGLESFKIVLKEEKIEYDVLKLISPHQNIISVDAAFQSIISGSFKISSKPMKLSLDLSRIFFLISNLDLKVNENLFEKLKIEKINHQFEVELNEIHFLPFYQNNIFFDFGFKSLNIHPNLSNLNEYEISLNDISLSHNNFYIIKNLNINSLTVHGIMNITIPYFKVNLMKNDFDKLDELKNVFQSATLLNNKIPFHLKNVKIGLEGVDIYSDLLKSPIVLKKSEIIYLEDLNKRKLTSNVSQIEIGYTVIEELNFKLTKEQNIIQSTFLVNNLHVKELKVNISSMTPFLKGTYNNSEETMDVNFGLDSIEFKDFNSLMNIKSFIRNILSIIITKENKKSDHLNGTLNYATNNTDISSNENNQNTISFLNSLFKLIGNKELKLPKINLTIHFMSRPISILYNNFNFFINFEWSILFNPFVFTLSIPIIRVCYNNDKYFEMKNFAFIFPQNSDITLTIHQIDLHITEKMIIDVKKICQNLQPFINNFSINSKKNFPNMNINIETISLKFIKLLNKYSFQIPLTQTSILINHKKDVNLNTYILIDCSDIGIETESFLLSMNYKSQRDDHTIELQISNQIQINFSPLEFRKIISTENFFYVNQTGIELILIVDDKQITIPDNSSFISPHLPKDPKICLINGKSKTSFDISKLCCEQSIACSFSSGMILIWKKQSLLIFSSPIEILNQTGYSIQLLDDYFQNAILPNNQNMFVSPLIESKVNTLSISFLGTKLKIKAKLLNYPYTVQEDDSKFRFIVDRNPTSLVARITITAAIFIRSYFPEPLTVDFSNKKFVLQPTIKVPICLFDVNTTKISFKLSSSEKTGYFKDAVFNVNISLSTGETSICLHESTLSNKQTFYLRCRVTDEVIKTDKIKVVELSAPIFIVNQLGLSVILHQNDNDKKILNAFNSVHSPKNNSMFRPCPRIPGFKYNVMPYCYVKDDDISFYLSNPTTMKYTKSKFGVSKINSKELALLPTSGENDSVMPVTFQVIHDETSTATILLKPYVIIYNDSNQSIQIDKNTIEKFNYLIVRSVSPSLDIVVNSNGLNIPINLENISDFSVSGPSLLFRIQFTISFINEIKCITISNVSSLGLFAVINETDRDFIINQAGVDTSQYFVLSQSSFMFDLSDTRTECAIECYSQNIPVFRAQLDHPMDVIPIPGTENGKDNLYYSVEIIDNRRYVAHFYQKSPSFEIENFKQFNYLFNVPSISLRLLGKHYREYCRVTLGSLLLHILQQEMKESIALSIESIQIDDMNEFADHPVALLSLKKPFFNLGLLRTIKSTFFEYLICTISPLAAEIDISFVIDMMSLFEFDSTTKEQQLFETEKFAIKSLSKSDNFHCHLLKVLPIDIDLSFFSKTTRSFHRFEQEVTIPRFLSIIPTIENVNIQMSPINAVELRCTPKELFLILLDNAKSSFSTQWLRLIGSAAIIGNPQKLVYNFSSAFKKPTKEIPKGLLLGTADTIGTLLKSGETTLKGLSSTFRLVSNDDSHHITDNKTALGGISWGFKSLVSGFAKAATGIVTKPIERAKEKGVAGAFQGAGEGIVGIVTNSVGGAVDLTAGIITGVRRSIFGEKVPKRIEEPMRRNMAYTRKVNEITGSFDASTCDAADLMFVFTSVEADVSDEFIFIGENKIDIDDVCWVKKMENSKVVVIEMKNEMEQISVEFKKEKTAKKFQSVIQIQIERKITQKFFSIPYSLQ